MGTGRLAKGGAVPALELSDSGFIQRVHHTQHPMAVVCARCGYCALPGSQIGAPGWVTRPPWAPGIAAVPQAFHSTTTSAASQPHHKAWAGTDCGFRIALPPVLLSKAMRWVGRSAMDLFRVTADDAATPDFAVPLPRPIPTFPLTKQLFGC